RDLAALGGPDIPIFAGLDVQVAVQRRGVEQTVRVSPVPVSSGRLGIRVTAVTSEDVGVLVQTVETGSCLEREGVRSGDRLLSFNGIPLLDPGHLATLEAACWEGFPVSLEVITRNDIRRSFTVPLDKSRIPSPQLPPGYHGINMSWHRDRPPEIAGLDAGSPAELAGLRKGDRILTVGDTPVTSAAGFLETMLRYRVFEISAITVRRGAVEGEGENAEVMTAQVHLQKEPLSWSVFRPEDGGGWNYLPFVKASNASLTARALRVLLESRRVLDCQVPDEMILGALRSLAGCRVQDPQAAAPGYSYDGRKIDQDIRGHLGRLLGVELASLLASREG
ncbi:MAG: PDZ domain-containing protein, partial [Dehalococcoidia bacterium]|nr:PDZ domain-containing protein [Dehalococcoidia bacterium]